MKTLFDLHTFVLTCEEKKKRSNLRIQDLTSLRSSHFLLPGAHLFLIVPSVFSGL